MNLVSFEKVTKEYNSQQVFKPATFTIKNNQRIALIGSNGTGKSTIIKLIDSQIKPDYGQIFINKDIKIGYLSQSLISDLENSIYQECEFVFQKEKELIQELELISNKISLDPSNSFLIEKYSKKESELTLLDGYNYKYKIETVLNMFSFTKEQLDRKLKTLSGGERSRVAFAKLLLENPDLLLLDEPTNHLDIITIEWLETFLKNYQGSILFATHDLRFIKNIANTIIEITNDELNFYNGNYEYYSKEKIVRYEQKMKAYKQQEAEIKKLKRFIEFYMPKPRFVSRAHDREKKLARIEKNKIDKPLLEQNKVFIDFKGEVRQGKTLLNFKNLTIGYKDKPLIKDLNFSLFGQDHLVILGDNGSGKTTLIKTLLKEIKPLSGEIEEKTDLKIGYLPQDFALATSNETIFEYFKKDYISLNDQIIFDHLGKFKFSYEDIKTKSLQNLSGGEMMRLGIAKLAFKFNDLLILDEPTNHLDLFAKSELEQALNSYSGTLIIVSHDRDFINNISNKILYLYQDKYSFYNGSYEEFKQDELDKIIKSKLNQNQENKKEITENKQTNLIIKEKKYSVYTYEKLLNQLDSLQEKLNTLNSKAFDPSYYSNQDKMKDLNNQISTTKQEIEKVENKILEMEN